MNILHCLRGSALVWYLIPRGRSAEVQTSSLRLCGFCVLRRGLGLPLGWWLSTQWWVPFFRTSSPICRRLASVCAPGGRAHPLLQGDLLKEPRHVTVWDLFSGPLAPPGRSPLSRNYACCGAGGTSSSRTVHGDVWCLLAPAPPLGEVPATRALLRLGKVVLGFQNEN